MNHVFRMSIGVRGQREHWLTTSRRAAGQALQPLRGSCWPHCGEVSPVQRCSGAAVPSFPEERCLESPRGASLSLTVPSRTVSVHPQHEKKPKIAHLEVPRRPFKGLERRWTPPLLDTGQVTTGARCRRVRTAGCVEPPLLSKTTRETQSTCRSLSPRPWQRTLWQ